jgi:hypothetical protein
MGIVVAVVASLAGIERSGTASDVEDQDAIRARVRDVDVGVVRAHDDGER